MCISLNSALVSFFCLRAADGAGAATEPLSCAPAPALISTSSSLLWLERRVVSAALLGAGRLAAGVGAFVAGGVGATTAGAGAVVALSGHSGRRELGRLVRICMGVGIACAR